MNRIFYAFFAVVCVFIGSGAQASSVQIQGHVKIENDEVAFRLTCEKMEACRIAMEDFEVIMTPSESFVLFQIVGGASNFKFYDETRHAMVRYGRVARTSPLYDTTDEAYVRNGVNKSVGFVKLSATRIE